MSKNDNVDFMAMRQRYINYISGGKKQITKDYEQHYLNFVKTNHLSIHGSLESLIAKS